MSINLWVSIIAIIYNCLEIRVKTNKQVQQRAVFWNAVLSNSLQLDPAKDYTGLKNNITNPN